ncbi:redox-sensitive transcriptional activator SoxR [Oricola indica]|uniref:redox-sensitive transcriptional activator SoxR n=1 Tax=Oricola indica TaxID=2872591 RepID=UPI003CCC11DD
MALKATDRLPIGELARRTGIAVSAIRYYEDQGLVVSERNTGGQRRFLRSDIRRLSFILIAQQFGFTLPQIREVLDRLPNGRTPNKADWTRIGETFRAELDRKIETLTELRKRLDKCVGCGCLSLTDCTLYNPQDRAANKGAGPRYLIGDKPEDP